MSVTNPELNRLAEIGFTAANHGMVAEAQRIFDGLDLWLPDSIVPIVGRAWIELNRGNYREAAKILRTRALTLEPGNATVLALAGLALRLDGFSAESDKLLAEAATAKDGNDGSSLARSLLGSARPEPRADD